MGLSSLLALGSGRPKVMEVAQEFQAAAWRWLGDGGRGWVPVTYTARW